jgi:hypothetical protein
MPAEHHAPGLAGVAIRRHPADETITTQAARMMRDASTRAGVTIGVEEAMAHRAFSLALVQRC